MSEKYLQPRQSAEKREDRTIEAAMVFKEATEAARAAGMDLIQHSETHYTLRTRGWILNLYPSNQRIYPDRKHKPPFLHVPEDPWGLMDVVEAATEQYMNTPDRSRREVRDGARKPSTGSPGVFMMGRHAGDDRKLKICTDQGSANEGPGTPGPAGGAETLTE